MEECLRSFEDLCPWKDVCALSSLAHNSTEIARKAERHKFTNSGSAKRMPPFFVLSFSLSHAIFSSFSFTVSLLIFLFFSPYIFPFYLASLPFFLSILSLPSVFFLFQFQSPGDRRIAKSVCVTSLSSHNGSP